MALGISNKRVKKSEPVDQEAREEAIQKKVYALANSIKIPAPINQFKTVLEGADLKKTLDLMRIYRPENKEEKKVRLESVDPKSGPKPILLKFGLRHVVDLIERKKLAFVLVAADVAPITLVLALPTLCKKFKISYAIVPSKEVLGSLVNQKSSAVVGIEDVRAEHKADFEDVKRIADAMFSSQYEKHMSTIGGRLAKKAEL
jgi:large subunit ribosomal protein L7Ae